MNQEYLSMFIEETREHLQAWSDGLLELEKTRDAKEVPLIFRAAHTIKGMAMTMGFKNMGEMTHQAENLLDGMRHGTIHINSAIVDVLFKSLDLLEQLLDGIEQEGEEPSVDTRAVLRDIQRFANGEAAGEAESSAEQVGAALDTGLVEPATSAVGTSIRAVAEQAIKDGHRVFEVSLGFDQSCQMPMARWAQVLLQINQNELLFTNPDAAVLDEGSYRGSIQFVLATQDDIEELGDRIANITDVIVESIHEWSHAAGGATNREQVLPSSNLTEAPHVVKVVETALKRGVNVYEVGIRFRTGTALKSARMYMVFEAIGGQDQLLFTQPTMRDIEQEKFDTDVLFIMWSDSAMDSIRQSIDSISDVELVELREWSQESGQAKRGENTVTERRVGERRQPKKASATVRVDTEKLDGLMNLFSELVIDKTRLEKIEAEMGHEDLSQTVSHMSRIANQLQELVMSIRMVPVSTVFSRFPRMVRDTAQQLNKEVDFQISGEGTELDRTVVEEIGDPIMHMLRNSLDHGLESAAARRQAGKPELGHISLRAYSAGNSVFIEVEDDGGGIDRSVVLDKAIRKGIVEPGANMSDDQVYQLLFASGFSTSDEITDLSGRGVGLDVVKSKIEALSGRIEVQSEIGHGTKFIIQLPMTLAIMQGLMVSVDGNPYLLPLGSVAQVEEGVEAQVLGGKEITQWRDEVVPLVRVREVFGLQPQAGGFTIFVRRGKKTLGLVVDDVLGQQEVVLKSLDKRLRTVRWLSGATILGDGTVALVLDSNSFF